MKKKTTIDAERVPIIFCKCGNFFEIKLGIVSAPLFSVSSLNLLPITNQMNPIPITHPNAIHIACIPIKNASPVKPNSSHADSPVALSERARENPEIFLSPRTNDDAVFARLAEMNAMESVITR